ncbi:MAG TPA: glutamate--tRNA ligase [Candidatus Polarisedimenticolaceae bacterium]|nr:glutamate--tRNA ligase [Candidatus Polarisedimenticolaceae bacterium]
MPPVRVRFAPSPTGYLHVGGARTAIFNWLYARRHGGVFVLRVEDTDAARSSEPMVRAILDGMAWLGMQADEGPFFQSRAREQHEADARKLLESGAAYRCFCPPGEPCSCGGLSEGAAGEAHAVRFRVPEGKIGWADRVHGWTEFEGSTLENFVLLRSDGSPTYMMSVVSDDVAMGITDVIRGDDHLSNTPKQILLYRALGKAPPTFAHLPLILGEDKKRLSKRHGAVSVLEYRDRGYLPEAMFTFLAMLGWSPGDDREKLSRDELVEAFDLSGVGRSGAVFDLRKLDWLNGQIISRMSVAEFADLVEPRLQAAGLWDGGWDPAWFARVLALLQPRARTLEDAITQGRPFFDPGDVLPYDPQAAAKHLKGEKLAEAMAALRARFASERAWEATGLEAALRETAERFAMPWGKLIHPTRLAVTGQGASPGLFEVLELLGRERTLARLDRLQEHLLQAR